MDPSLSASSSGRICWRGATTCRVIIPSAFLGRGLQRLEIRWAIAAGPYRTLLPAYCPVGAAALPRNQLYSQAKMAPPTAPSTNP